MKEAHLEHPSSEQLRAFAEGELPMDEFAKVAAHIEYCAQCCRHLETQPNNNTLLALAREAVTLGGRLSLTSPVHIGPTELPAELEDHPRYRVIELIGSGGMGSVYRAEHRLMQRVVALKVVHSRLLRDAEAIERFEREVRHAARLSHPNIVVSYDADRAEDLHFLVMEYVEGVTLDNYVAQRGAVEVSQACDWIRQAAMGLQHAYEQGMVHRDIKPQNLMVTSDGILRILDFGLSRVIKDREHAIQSNSVAPLNTAQTRADVILGTPDYMAPEQITKSRDADIRADIYSLGCTLYFLLTGKAPFGGRTVRETLDAHLKESILPVSSHGVELSSDLKVVLERMTAKNPGDRYQTPAELISALTARVIHSPENALASEPTKPRAHLAASDQTGDGIAKEGKLSAEVVRPGRSRFKLRRWSLLVIASFGLSLATGYGWRNSIGSLFEASEPVRLLVMLPSQGLWFPDYQALVEAAAPAQVRLSFASLEERPSELLSSSIPGVAVPDLKLDENIKANDFDGIIFIGYETSEFSPGGSAGDEVRRLLNEFQMQKKVIASICAGQRVLAQHGAIRGKSVAPAKSVRREEIEGGGGRRVDENLVVDGLIVTAFEAQFASSLLDAIKKIRKS